MPLTLFETTFLTVAQADERLGVVYPKWWLETTTAEKERWLTLATSLLSEQPYLSSALEPDQPLAFPRYTFTFYDPSLRREVTVTEGTVPERLKRATAALALHLYQNPSLTDDSKKTYESISVGPITVSDSLPDKAGSVPLLPYSTVKAVIRPLLVETGLAGRMPWRAW